MTLNGWIQIALYALLVPACVKPLGLFMARVFEGERTFPLARSCGPSSASSIALAAWTRTRNSTGRPIRSRMLLFSVGWLPIHSTRSSACRRWLPFNPEHLGAVSPDSSFNTAVSFVTNTNWQGYGGETTMSYLTQMAALTVQNFVSAAAGIALAIALIRGFARRSAKTVGNFWVDLTRCTLYVLLPLSIVVALVARLRWACRRTSIPIPMRRRWKAPSRSSRKALPPRRSRSSSSAPMAAASSMSIPPIRSRTRMRFPI